ncbi:helix-turn-helix domain-containing protein [Mesorhizobium sp. YC-39]|nr:helix-turn-helix domain-containing protein [Mesorhizobium sp. YC-2]MCV3233364.1 helix-turn-helix domain-containing protein [Mesorhizobium sp. YC-39]
MLISSRLPVVEIAMACGFVSASHFSKAYREVYRCAPHESRLPVYSRKKMRSTRPEGNRTRQIDRRPGNAAIPNCH